MESSPAAKSATRQTSLFRPPFGTIMPGGSAASIPGLQVGAATAKDDGWLTGTTVLVPPPGTVAGVDVRGGGPAGHETDVIAPGTHSPGVDAIVLTGGSAWGLAAVLGVQQGLAADGRGFPAPMLPGEFVPIVPAAAVYDLGRGDGTLLHPGADMGREAYRSAVARPATATPATVAEAPVRGSVGGGTGAFIGRGLLRGGLGSVCVRTPSGHLVAAIVVANPMGDVLESSGELYAASVLRRMGVDLPLAPADWVDQALTLDATAAGDVLPPRNTTIAAIVTDAQLDSAQTTRLAQSAQAGLARAIHPSHTMFDGDTVFALATGGVSSDVDPMTLVGLNCAAADALSLAIVDAAISAEPHRRDGSVSSSQSAQSPAPRPAALREVAPDLATAWETVSTTGT